MEVFNNYRNSHFGFRYILTPFLSVTYSKPASISSLSSLTEFEKILLGKLFFKMRTPTPDVVLETPVWKLIEDLWKLIVNVFIQIIGFPVRLIHKLNKKGVMVFVAL